MNSLPEDILFQIASLFCFHCQNPGEFQHCDTREVRDQKRTLARLCRVSKNLCIAAQPVLYHCYGTGNVKNINRIYEKTEEEQKYAPGYDFLPQFLQTIVNRPDLASKIVSMQMVHDQKFVGYKPHLEMIDSLIEWAETRSLVPRPAVPDDWREGHFAQWRFDGERASLRTWLVTMALVLAPSLRKLFLSFEDTGGFEWSLGQAPHLKLPNLRTLAMMGHEGDYHIKELDSLFFASPNLQTIYACDAAGWGDHASWSNHGSFEQGLEYDLPLENLRCLSITDLIPSNLGSLLPSVPQLQELEYFWDRYELKDFSLVDILQPVKENLRRLCIAYLPPSYFEYEAPEVDYDTVESLADFEKMEILEIDCRSIYRPGDRDDSSRLTILLPRGIRRLRISYLYRGMVLALSGLAARAAEDFPSLKHITIGIADANETEHEKRSDEIETLCSTFRTLGVRLELEYDRVGPERCTIIPSSVLRKRRVPVPGVLTR